MLTRREFAAAAAAAGAVLAFGTGSAAMPAWRERRDDAKKIVVEKESTTIIES